MKQMASRSSRNALICVKRLTIDAECDAATRSSILRDRRDAGTQVQVRAIADQDGHAAFRQQFEFLGP
jgi:hypothetical protein